MCQQCCHNAVAHAPQRRRCALLRKHNAVTFLSSYKGNLYLHVVFMGIYKIGGFAFNVSCTGGHAVAFMFEIPAHIPLAACNQYIQRKR